MNTINLSIKYYVALALLTLVSVVLVGCGSVEVGSSSMETSPLSNEAEEARGTGVEIGIEPTPIPETVSYANDFYGFKFEYPSTWTLTEIDHGILLMQDANRLTVNFHWANEDIAPFRTGMAAGTPIYSDKISFMGQVVPVYIVELDHLTKYVLYSEKGEINVDDLVFVAVLEDLKTDYTTLDLPETVIAEAALILESFERIAPTGSKPEVPTTQVLGSDSENNTANDMSVYENREYGFLFSYPSSMALVEEPNKVILNYDGNIQLTIAYRRTDESINISGISKVPGQIVPYSEVSFLDQPVEVVLDVQDDLIKAAYLGVPGIEIGELTRLRFVFRLESTDEGSISNPQVDRMLMIFDNFVLTN